MVFVVLLLTFVFAAALFGEGKTHINIDRFVCVCSGAASGAEELGKSRICITEIHEGRRLCCVVISVTTC